jgi:hypothetical protein
MHLHCMFTAAQRLRTTAISLVFRHAVQLNISAKMGVTDGELSVSTIFLFISCACNMYFYVSFHFMCICVFI